MKSFIPIHFSVTDRNTASQPVALQRRSFLKASAILTGLLAVGSPLALLAPSRAWAMELAHLKQQEADTVLLLAKTLYPHQGLPDAVYALLVKDIDAKAATPESSKMIQKGIKKLLTSSKGKWLSLGEAERTRLITALQKDPFIEMVRAQCITSLYDNEMAFAHFGYPGESFNKGGYLYRGFNDLTWLPEPSASASPAASE